MGFLRTLKRPSTTGRSRTSAVTIIVPVAIYLFLIVGQGFWMRDQINADGVSYIRNAKYLIESRFYDSISGYWSPALSWSIAPLLWFKIDGLYSARLALGLWGCMFLVVCYFFMRSLSQCPLWLRVVSLSLISVWCVDAATSVIAPDLPMFVFIMAYFSVVILPNFLKRKRLQVLCGAFGAGAFLAKSYGFPFFLIHFTFSVGLHWVIRRGTFSARKAALAWGIGFLTFLILSGPWVALLSVKYDHLTVSTVARIAHTIIGPRDKPRYHPMWDESEMEDVSNTFGMYKVPPGRISAWETPEDLPYNHWSPFESWRYFKHQVKHVITNAYRMIIAMGNYDVFHITLPALLFFPVLVAAFPRWTAGRFKAVWMLGTVAIYSSGFLLVYWTERYTYYFLLPLCCIYCICFGAQYIQRITSRFRMPTWTECFVSTILVISFTSVAANHVRGFWFFQTGVQGDASYRKVAHEMRAEGRHGPIAAVGPGAAYASLYLAYHLDEPYVGQYLGKMPTNVDAILEEFGVETLLVSAKGKRSTTFRNRTSWKPVREVHLNDEWMYIYTPP